MFENPHHYLNNNTGLVHKTCVDIFPPHPPVPPTPPGSRYTQRESSAEGDWCPGQQQEHHQGTESGSPHPERETAEVYEAADGFLKPGPHWSWDKGS